MKTLRFLFLFAILLPFSCKQHSNLPKDQKEYWIQLFNGKDIKDWDVKIRGHQFGDNYLNTFGVENGLLTVSYDNYQDFGNVFGHLFYNKPFSNYILRAEYRFIGDQCPGGPEWAFRNNGLMLHSQSAESMGLDQDFPISIEVQLLGGNGKDDRPTANLCTPGTDVFMNDALFTTHCVNSTSETFHGDQWVNVTIEVYSDSLIRHKVDGETVLTYTHPRIGGGAVSGLNHGVKTDGTPLKGGFIAIQAESHPTQFRKIEIREINR